MKQLSKVMLPALAIACAVCSASSVAALPFAAVAAKPSASLVLPVKMACDTKEHCAAKPARHVAKHEAAPVRSARRESIFVDTQVYANPQSGQYGHYGFYGQGGSFGATGFRPDYNLGGYDHSFELRMN
jgi:hypothetical protein